VVADSESVSRGTSRCTPTIVAAFILRYEHDADVSELYVERLPISGDIRDRWDCLLYRCLTPTAYETIRDTFCLRVWRHPRWIEKSVAWRYGARSVEDLHAILQEVKEEDILWVQAVKAGQHERS
jgi:hypothetical protein